MERLDPTPGAIARVRQRTHLIEEVRKPRRVKDSTLVRLSCLDDDNQGAPLEVLWERELDKQLLDAEDWDAIASKGFDSPGTFSSYFNTLKWNCVTATDPKLFQSPFRAGIRLDAYQLEPLRKALRLPRVNLFIADDVGLGKTIEAALIAREMLLRKRVRDIVVSAPPSMLLQWQEELENRFGLTFQIIDKDYLKQVRQERGFAVNPWTTHSRFLISHRLLTSESYAGPFRDWLGTFRSGSMFILDEAHHAAPASGQKYAIDSKITRAVEDFAKRFEHRLFLSATPHNGHSNSFSRLLELLDPQRFCRGVPVTPEHRDEVVIRRIKEDIRAVQGGFPERKVVQVDIDGLPAETAELRLMDLLSRYRDLRDERNRSLTKRQQAASALLIIGLQQRLLSSVEAFARTLKIHRSTVVRQWEATQGKRPAAVPSSQLDLLDGGLTGDDDRATSPEDEVAAEVDSQIELASAATAIMSGDANAADIWRQEQLLLDEMTDIAEAARGRPDARIVRLVEWIRQHMCPDLPQRGDGTETDARWNDIRVLIFTEYDDTKRYIVQQLRALVDQTHRGPERIDVFHGPTPLEKREEIKRAFNAAPDKHPLRILVATDAAREGLNLQANCFNLFHFDVPWNPSRMEQRNGRIDRKLQPSDTVYCHYYYYRQRPEDRILRVLVRKTETIRQELGSLSKVIDASLVGTMKSGIRRDRIDKMEAQIDEADLAADHKQAIETELEGARLRQVGLREQIEELRDILDRSKRSIGLNENLFRLAVSSSLEILGSESLTDAGGSTGGPKQLVFPSLDQRSGADATWAETMDTLRAPKKRGQKHWEWRRDSPIRPVVFKDPGRVTDEVVHLHLEHRVVQRLLGRFTTQGFVHDDLSRACLTQTTDAIPRVILVGRLALYGHGAARLHEELVPVAARWTDPGSGKRPLRPYARDAQSKTIDLLDGAFLDAPNQEFEQQVIGQLQESAAQDVSELLEHLQEVAGRSADNAKKELATRAEAEAKSMREILVRQEKYISGQSRKFANEETLQGMFDFKREDEQEQIAQLKANQRHWTKRLELLKGELKSEPERIRKVYEVIAQRIEPIGIVYLWPTSS